MRRLLILTMAALCASSFVVPAAHAATWIEQYKYPRPSGMLCSTVGAGACWTTSTADQYRQRVNVAGSGNGWGWLHTMTGQNTASMPSVCYYGYPSYDVWRAYGSPSGMRICVRVGFEYVLHEFSRMRFEDLPEQDRSWFEPDRFIVTEYRTGTGKLVADRATHMQFIEGSQLVQYCERFTARDINGSPRRGVAVDRASASIMQACGLTQRVSDLPPEPPNDDWSEGSGASGVGETQPAADAGGFAIPGSAARCGAVRSGAQHISVRSARHGCSTARDVLRSYARGLRSPRGWSCMAVVRDTGLRARCMQRRAVSGRARARAAVFGIWRR